MPMVHLEELEGRDIELWGYRFILEEGDTSYKIWWPRDSPWSNFTDSLLFLIMALRLVTMNIHYSMIFLAAPSSIRRFHPLAHDR